MTLLQLSDGHMAEYIYIFKRNPGDGTATLLMHFVVDFACDRNCRAKFSLKRIYCYEMMNL